MSSSGARVVAVVDQRLVKPLERRARVDGGVLEADLLEHVHHEVRCGLSLRRCARWWRAACLARHRVGEIVRERRQLDGRSWLNRRCLCSGVLPADDETGGAQRGALEEVPAVERSVACDVVFISHDGLLNAAS